MTPEQVQFCYDIVQGRQDGASSHLSRIEILPENEIFKKTDFKFFPAIFCLWAAGQHNAEAIAKKLQQLYPKPVPEELKPTNIKHIHHFIREHIFPLIKSSLIPLLQNFAKLAVPNDIVCDDRQYFSLIASAEALHLILHDEFFVERQPDKLEMAQHRLEIMQRIYEKLKPHVDLAKFEKQLTSFRQTKNSSDEKPVPDAIKSLIAALNSQTSTELQLEFGRTYLASNGLKKMQTSYLPSRLKSITCRAEEEAKQLSFLISPVH